MPFKLKPLANQTVVITGASSGIGLITARKAACAGARVFLISRNGSALERICAKLLAIGYEAAFAVADVGNASEVKAACASALARFGGFDTWINVAGVAIYSNLLETPKDEHERLFLTNYWGVVNCAAAAVPHLAKRGGAFITVGSVASDLGTPMLGAYAASKHAVKGFVDSLRIELLATGSPVSVTLIKPSGIGSPLAEHAANHMEHAAKVPPPSYAPELVADAILYAATHRRREITVGGVGRLQILGAAHVPGILDRISGWLVPLLKDQRRPPNAASNLFRASAGGHVLSKFEGARRVSLYTAATLHPAVTTGICAVALGLAMTLAARSRHERR